MDETTPNPDQVVFADVISYGATLASSMLMWSEMDRDTRLLLEPITTEINSTTSALRQIDQALSDDVADAKAQNRAPAYTPEGTAEVHLALKQCDRMFHLVFALLQKAIQIEKDDENKTKLSLHHDADPKTNNPSSLPLVSAINGFENQSDWLKPRIARCLEQLQWLKTGLLMHLQLARLATLHLNLGPRPSGAFDLELGLRASAERLRVKRLQMARTVVRRRERWERLYGFGLVLEEEEGEGKGKDGDVDVEGSVKGGGDAVAEDPLVDTSVGPEGSAGSVVIETAVDSKSDAPELANAVKERLVTPAPVPAPAPAPIPATSNSDTINIANVAEERPVPLRTKPMPTVIPTPDAAISTQTPPTQPPPPYDAGDTSTSDGFVLVEKPKPKETVTPLDAWGDPFPAGGLRPGHPPPMPIPARRPGGGPPLPPPPPFPFGRPPMGPAPSGYRFIPKWIQQIFGAPKPPPFTPWRGVEAYIATAASATTPTKVPLSDDRLKFGLESFYKNKTSSAWLSYIDMGPEQRGIVDDVMIYAKTQSTHVRTCLGVEEFKREDEPSEYLVFVSLRFPPRPIAFKCCIGRKFLFPHEHCKEWDDMKALIDNAFLHVEVVGPQVLRGYYDLLINGVIVMPSLWNSTIKPGDRVTMYMWPMSDVVKPGPGLVDNIRARPFPGIRPPGHRAGLGGPPPPPPPGFPGFTPRGAPSSGTVLGAPPPPPPPPPPASGSMFMGSVPSMPPPPTPGSFGAPMPMPPMPPGMLSRPRPLGSIPPGAEIIDVAPYKKPDKGKKKGKAKDGDEEDEIDEENWITKEEEQELKVVDFRALVERDSKEERMRLLDMMRRWTNATDVGNDAVPLFYDSEARGTDDTSETDSSDSDSDSDSDIL